MDIFNTKIFLTSVIPEQLTVLQSEDIAVYGQCVCDPVNAGLKIPDICIKDPWIVYDTEAAILTEDDHALRSACIDISGFIFSKSLYQSRRQTVTLGVHLYISEPVDDGSSVVVCTDPEIVIAVDKKAYHARNSGLGTESLEGGTVVSDKSAVASDPEKTI